MWRVVENIKDPIYNFHVMLIIRKIGVGCYAISEFYKDIPECVNEQSLLTFHH